MTDSRRSLPDELADDRDRALACTEFVRPLAIEAGAGTGKTRTLVARIGSWLLGRGWEQAAAELASERAARGAPPPTAAEIAVRACEGVVAITFTEAAAAEMADRVEKMLGQAAAGVPMKDLERLPDGVSESEAHDRGDLLIAASGRLRISTIHGFCHRLLAEYPVEAGLHPGFRVDADGELTHELATSVLVDLLRQADAGLVGLLAAGVDPPQLLAALEKLVQQGVRAEDLEADPFAGGALERRTSALRAAIAELLRVARPLRVGKCLASIAEGLAALGALDARLDGLAPGAGALAELRPLLAETRASARKIVEGWAKGTFGKAEETVEDLPELRRRAAAVARELDALAEIDPELLLRARAALVAPLRRLLGRRRAEGVLSFDDLLERAAALLAEEPPVRARVRRGIRQLLVDEFQDTDRRQCDLVRSLVLAESVAPAPGLFLVGDPKQSIFGFRSADLAAYEGFLSELERAGGVEGSLVVNFRSVPPVLDEVERALRPVLVEDRGIQAGFQRLEPSPAKANATGFRADGRAPVEYWLSSDPQALGSGKATLAGDATAIEAAAVARDIQQLVAAGRARFRDFAILLRARGDLDDYLEALRDAGVPYVVQKDRSYYRRREVVDTAAAVRAILDPPDLLALVAFLRSPFVGVPDAAWLPLWREGFPGLMVELDGSANLDRALDAVRRAAADPAVDRAAPGVGGWAESLALAVESIGSLRADFRRSSSAEWVERLRSLLLLEPIAASRYLGRFGLANLERLLDDVQAWLAEEPDPARALARLRLAVARETATEEARPPDQTDDAVSVLTIHTAKGLQFEHVYLVQAHRRPGGPRGEKPSCEVGPPARFREMRLFGAPTPGWRELEHRRKLVAAAEAGRLLYVAMTRSIQRLVVCGLFGGATRAVPAEDVVPSFADLLRPRLPENGQPTPASPSVEDAHGVRWRAPALEPGWTKELSGERRDVDSPTVAGPRDFERLAGRRAESRARAARPRFATASAHGVAGEPDARAPRLDEGGAGSRRSRSPTPADARALGTALHRALEIRGSSPAADWRGAARSAHATARAGAAADDGALEAALDRLDGSRLAGRLAELASAVVARELPLLLAAGRSATEGPIDGWTGTLDLLYRDPADDRLVVADFKTDVLSGDDELPALVDRYRPQLELYGRAVREALGLADPPRLELWLIDRDEIHVVPAR